MNWSVGHSVMPIGIDIGSRQFRVVQMRSGGEQRQIKALCAVARLKPLEQVAQEEVFHLRSVLARQGFSGREAVLTVPSRKLMTGILELPPRNSGAPLDQIAKMELSRMHRVEPDSFTMAYWDLPIESRPGVAAQAMAVACKHADADELLDMFEVAGFDVQALEARGCAIARACRPLLRSGQSLTAIVEFGWSRSCLIVFRGETIVYERPLAESGMGRLVEEVAERYGMSGPATEKILTMCGLAGGREVDGISPDVTEDLARMFARFVELLVDQLDQPFAYVRQQYAADAVERLLLVGDFANVPGLASHIGENAEINTMTVSPTDLAECHRAVLAKSGDPALTVASGLALFGEE